MSTDDYCEKDALNSQKTKEEPAMLLAALPVYPGTDLSSKLLVKGSQMKDIIIRVVMGKGIASDAYYVGFCEQHDGRKTEQKLPSVIVEVQQKIHHIFITRAMRYCPDLLEETKTAPILAVSNVDGVLGKEFFERTFTIGDNPYYTQYCHPWFKSVYLFNTDSVPNHIQETPLQTVITLADFFTQQQQHFMTLDYSEHPTLQMTYQTEYKSFFKDANFVFDQNLVWEDYCDAVASQFNKIIKAANDNTTTLKNAW